ncbi:MAG: Cdc6/Cdc18 family protein [Natronomonas sp.]
MIHDARVLQDEFIPREVEHRDGEVNALSGALQPVADGDRPDPVLLHGPSGAGKTCIAKFTVERLREQLVTFEHVYINCWHDYTRFRVLYRILDAVGETLDIHRQSTPKDELLSRVRDYDWPPTVVVLDEVDQLEDPELLYDLYSIPDLTMILVANREEQLFVRLSQRLQSRLQCARRVRFDAYSFDELIGILDARVEWGLRPDAIDRSEIERIADAAAGDARVAIGVLRNAARTAESEGTEHIRPEHVADAVRETHVEVQQKHREKLTPHQEVLYEIVESREEIAPGELYDSYRERVDDPRTERTLRNYLAKMEQYSLIVAEGERRGRRYRTPA